MAPSSDSACDPPLTEREFQFPTSSSDPIISPTLPFYSRITTAVRLWLFKITVWAALGALRLSRRTSLPSFTKYYDVRPDLQCRVFLPPNTSVSTTTKVPLYINIHGGGFALCDPSVDDFFAKSFSRQHSIIVVSIAYRRAPRYRFPTPVGDAVALINAILADPLLPIDSSRTALGGFSAGGNLTLSAALHPSLKGKLSALLPVYPVVDFSGKYKGSFRKDPSGKRDMLENTASWFNWGYVPAGIDKKHPLLSPIYAPRDAFAAQKMFFVGAEYDYLCTEASNMADKLAGRGETKAPVDVAKLEEKWDENGIKWKMYRGQQHGFTHTTASGEAEKLRKKATDDCFTEMGRWLQEDVWAKSKNPNGQANGNLVNI